MDLDKKYLSPKHLDTGPIFVPSNGPEWTTSPMHLYLTWSYSESLDKVYKKKTYCSRYPSDTPLQDFNKQTKK